MNLIHRRQRLLRGLPFALMAPSLCSAFVLVNNGEEDVANGFVGTTTNLTALILRAFQSNTTPAETDVTATYTEATFTGYANISLTPGSWTVTPGAPTLAAYAQQTWTSSAGSQNQSVYGYYMTRTTNGRLAIAERFTDGPYVIVNNGDQIKVTPNVNFD